MTLKDIKIKVEEIRDLRYCDIDMAEFIETVNDQIDELLDMINEL